MTTELKEATARSLYLSTDKTQKEICSIVGWSEKTFCKQKQKGNWDELKDTRSLTKQQIISLLHVQCLKIIDQAKNEDRALSAREIDSIAKLASSIDKLEKRASLETYIEVFEEYNKWLMIADAAFAQSNNAFQNQFINLKINHANK